MSRALLIIDTPEDRQQAILWASKARYGTRIEFRDPARSTEQNSRLWVFLTRISRELCWHGQYYPPEMWKDYFMHALKGELWMPFEGGGMIPVGRSTSRLTVSEHSQLTTLIEAFAARQGIEL